MGGDDYLDGLPPERAAELARVNDPGLTALRDYLASGRAVAFLGAGVSAPLYPLWTRLIGDLIDAAASRLDDGQAETLRALASQSPEEVVEIIRTALGTGPYREVLRQVFRVRTDEETGRSWTPVQELVCRCAFQAVVTTNYDPGIVDARMRVRPDVSATGFTTWEDELEAEQLEHFTGRAEELARLDRWAAALRLAARHQFAWHELDALRAHALLDQTEGIDRGWAAKAEALHTRLVPPGLDPDPLGTVERLVAAQKAAKAAKE